MAATVITNVVTLIDTTDPEPHRFELYKATYMQIVFNKYSQPLLQVYIQD